jgi:hypothetical protein
MSTRTLLTGIAALLMATSAVHAASPWTEADGENTIFLALKNVTCGTVRYTVWIPYVSMWGVGVTQPDPAALHHMQAGPHVPENTQPTAAPAPSQRLVTFAW